MLISKKAWKLFIPILFMIIIILLAIYSRDLLKYGNRQAWPISQIVEAALYIIMGISIMIILYFIEIFLTTQSQEQKIIKQDKKIIKFEKELEELKKKE